MGLKKIKQNIFIEIRMVVERIVCVSYLLTYYWYKCLLDLNVRLSAMIGHNSDAVGPCWRIFQWTGQLALPSQHTGMYASVYLLVKYEAFLPVEKVQAWELTNKPKLPAERNKIPNEYSCVFFHEENNVWSSLQGWCERPTLL